LSVQLFDPGVEAVLLALEVPDVFPILALEQAAGFVALRGEVGDAGKFDEFADELGDGEAGAALERLGHGEEGGIGLRGAGELIRGGEGGAGCGRMKVEG